jgi:hypothetical protein
MQRIRPCAACGKEDDHPRHVISLTPTESLFFHMDCHANNGCDTCKQQIADAKGAKGDKLRGHLIALREDSDGS